MEFQWNEEFFLDTDNSKTTHSTLEIGTVAASSGRIDNSLDIVGLLPPEISWRCISESLPSLEEQRTLTFISIPWSPERGNQRRSYPASLLQLTSVSTKWLDLIVHCPLLWNEIHIDSSIDDLLAVLATFIQLSGTAPLEVVIWCRQRIEWDRIGELFQEHKHRITHLVLSNWPRPGQGENLRYFQEFIRPLGHLTGLVEFDFGGFIEPITASLLLPNLPPGVVIVNTARYDLEDVTTHNDVLERCVAINFGSISFQDIAPVLSRLTVTKRILIESKRNAKPEPKHDSLTAVPPHLQSIIYNGPYSPSLGRIFQLAYSSLRQMSLVILASGIGELVENLRLLTQLQGLWVWFQGSAPEEFQFSVKPTDVAVTSLRQLRIFTSGTEGTFTRRNNMAISALKYPRNRSPEVF
ncbi:hypothetical protein M408DRAFT_11958 [Serendipita vermifera MAFF 305830]|uniref:F-box domain-containing protein n=1 Tax=Serendipita vermifera MAFF 305830 TaxID=933852 RepID=A0A0C3ADB1_SERVB|nr:hypothetical protein M408DRAFT_11958 [Serendipita vermifera MAFF 305830]